MKDPVISGSLKSNTESAATLEIAYDKAFGEEIVEIEATLDGPAAEGLSISSPYQSVIEREGAVRFRCLSPVSPWRWARWFAM